MTISIKEISNDKFEVKVIKKSTTKHIVKLSDKTQKKLTNKNISKKKIVKLSFNFLLERESNTSILSLFDIEIISKYFPEYEKEIKKLLQ